MFSNMEQFIEFISSLCDNCEYNTNDIFNEKLSDEKWKKTTCPVLQEIIKSTIDEDYFPTKIVWSDKEGNWYCKKFKRVRDSNFWTEKYKQIKEEKL
ncbi:MAG: hypothetical protein ACOC56_04360 [Atribacterota bacterium]